MFGLPLRRSRQLIMLVCVTVVLSGDGLAAEERFKFEAPADLNTNLRKSFHEWVYLFHNGGSTEKCQAILGLSDLVFGTATHNVICEIAFQHSDELVRRTAFASIEANEEMLPELIQALQNESPAVRLRAAFAVAESLSCLSENVSCQWESRKASSQERRNHLLSFKAKLVEDPDPVVRGLFQLYWSDYASEDETLPDIERSIPVILEALKIERSRPIPFSDSDGYHGVMFPLFALGQLGSEGGPAVPVLIDELKSIEKMPLGASNHGDFDAAYCEAIIESLVSIGTPALPALMEVLEAEESLQRRLAAITIPAIAPDNKEVIPLLIQSLHGPCWGINTYVGPSRKDVNSYSRLGTHAIPSLFDALHEDESLKEYGVEIIRKMSRQHDLAKTLRKYLDDERPVVRYVAAKGALSLETDAVSLISKLKEVAKNDDSEQVREAARSSIEFIEAEIKRMNE